MEQVENGLTEPLLLHATYWSPLVPAKDANSDPQRDSSSTQVRATDLYTSQKALMETALVFQLFPAMPDGRYMITGDRLSYRS